jgi:hypothetical protein
MRLKSIISVFLMAVLLGGGFGCQFLQIFNHLGGKQSSTKTPSSGIGFSSDVPEQPDPTAPRRAPTAQDPP